jgi:hypothetical protein
MNIKHAVPHLYNTVMDVVISLIKTLCSGIFFVMECARMPFQKLFFKRMPAGTAFQNLFS